MRYFFIFSTHFFFFLLLTTITQLGGIIWIFTILIIRKFFGDLTMVKKRATTFVLFLILYTVVCYLIVPPLAEKYGRVRLPYHSSSLQAANLFTIICNRNYVKPSILEVLTKTASTLKQDKGNLSITYLDACFPFFDGFPLLPHLSHNDGKKIDLAFFYRNIQSRQLVNEQPSNSGYGIYEGPLDNDENKTSECKSKGNKIYDFSRYLTFGTNKNLVFDQNTTAKFIFYLAKSPYTHKILLEPHLKKRLGFQHENKIRFQGCHSVRHDDHLHLEIR